MVSTELYQLNAVKSGGECNTVLIIRHSSEVSQWPDAMGGCFRSETCETCGHGGGLASRSRRLAVRSARASSDSATAVITAGLARLGLIESADAKIDGCRGGDSCFQYRLYYMHALSHPIGLDVHDVDQLSKTGHYGVGSAFTIEPGIYVRENTLDIIPHTPRNAQLLAKIAPAVRKYANIGVRIEDDYIVTAAGFDRITSGAPREMDAIEREMAVRAPLAGRDSALIEAYKKIRP